MTLGVLAAGAVGEAAYVGVWELKRRRKTEGFPGGDHRLGDVIRRSARLRAALLLLRRLEQFERVGWREPVKS